MKIILFKAVVILLLVVMCYNSYAQNTSHPFHFGMRDIGYSDSGTLAQESGVQWATVNLEWQLIEPTKGNYDWSIPDTYVNGLRNNGVEPYFIIHCYSQWGTPDIWEGLPRQVSRCWTTTIPKDSVNIQAWKVFVREFVERYDNDGDPSDMPGLDRPVNYLQVSEEWPSAWVGGFYETISYVDMLKITSEAAKAANPDVKIIVAGLTTGYLYLVYADDYIVDNDGGLFKGVNYTKNQIKSGAIKNVYHAFNASIRYIIENGGDYFDIFSIHAFEQKETFLEGKILWLYDRLAEYGYEDKDVLISGGNGPFRNTQEEIDCMDEYCNKLDPYPSNCPDIESFDGDCSFGPWTAREQAEFVVKIYTITTANNVIGPPWNMGSSYFNAGGQPWNGPFIHSRLVNSDGRKPAFYTYGILTSKISEFDISEKLEDGVYKFMIDGEPLFIAWDNDSRNLDLSAYLTGLAKIKHIVTELDSFGQPIYPEDIEVPVNSVPLTQSPIIVTDTLSNSVEEPTLLDKLKLCQNYPNPFNSITEIRIEFAKSSQALLEVYNLMGEKVATLLNIEVNEGIQKVKFNSEGLSSGMYFYQLKTDDQVLTKKCLKLKFVYR